MAVVVSPTKFTMVEFDHGEIVALAEHVADEVGLSGRAITVTIDERTPEGRIRVTSLDPIEIDVEGGAFEDLRELRKLSPTRLADGLGLHLLQVADRLDPAFGSPELGAELPLPHRVAWDVYSMGRLARMGHPSQRQRRLYHFRNRHGFTDSADAAFDRLWASDGLNWVAIVAISDAARPAAA